MTEKTGSSAQRSKRILIKRVVVRQDPVKFSKKIVILCIVSIIVYTILHTYLDYVHAVEISPTLTTCVFTFFGTELASSALIKIFDKDSKPADREGFKEIDG